MSKKNILLLFCLLLISNFTFSNKIKTSKTRDPFIPFYNIDWVEDCNLDVWHFIKIENKYNRPYINLGYGFSEKEWRYILSTNNESIPIKKYAVLGDEDIEITVPIDGYEISFRLTYINKSKIRMQIISKLPQKYLKYHLLNQIDLFNCAEVNIEGMQSSEVTPGEYPRASERFLVEEDLSGLTKWDLKIMRNEIFARHGYIFKTEEMKSYFGNKDWYQPNYEAVDDMLTDIEKDNINFIKKHEGL